MDVSEKYLKVPITRNIVFAGLYRGPSIYGSYRTLLCKDCMQGPYLCA